jgi:hypothetical protein
MINGKLVLVSGASSGIGAAIAKAMAKAGGQRIGKIKHIFSAASPVPPGACPMGSCLVGLVW